MCSDRAFGGDRILQLRHIPALQTQGFPGLSAWLVNRASRQDWREWRRGDPFSASVPPTHPPRNSREPRKTCDTRRRHQAGRGFAVRSGGVGKGTEAEPSLPGADALASYDAAKRRVEKKGNPAAQQICPRQGMTCAEMLQPPSRTRPSALQHQHPSSVPCSSLPRRSEPNAREAPLRSSPCRRP
jgi:hypothetical protein